MNNTCKATSTDPVLQSYINQYGEDEIISAGIVLLHAKERKLESLDDVAVFLCETMLGHDCCPVVTDNYDFRKTESDREGVPCFCNLYEWLLDQALGIIEFRYGEYRRKVVYEPIESEKENGNE